MNHQFEQIKELYEESFSLHGDSPAALLTPKGRSELRFRAIAPFLSENKVSILDYGCGLGYLYEYLIKLGCNIDYTGVDILPSFVQTCRQKYPDQAKFRVVDPTSDITKKFDVVFSSGVFNLATSADEKTSKEYAFNKLEQLFKLANEALICDFPSPFVDFKQDKAQHFSLEEIAKFCVDKLTRRFTLRHDLLPYEFTLTAYRRADIQRPENFFKADSAICDGGENG